MKTIVSVRYFVNGCALYNDSQINTPQNIMSETEYNHTKIFSSITLVSKKSTKKPSYLKEHISKFYFMKVFPLPVIHMTVLRKELHWK